MIIGIDASRNRSGGAKAHIVGIISELEPFKHDILEVHIWSYKVLLDLLPDRPWLIKHNPLELEKSLARQLWWQAVKLPAEAKHTLCDILFSTDASTLCSFQPMVVLSQDMLSYEPGVMKYFGFTKARLRLLAILYLQNWSLKNAAGAIFLTRYAGNVIQASCGVLENVKYIPHGVSEEFKSITKNNRNYLCNDEIKCLYISPVWEFKHQWVVVKALSKLRDKKINIKLKLVGGGNRRACITLDNQIKISDPQKIFVERTDFIPQSTIPSELALADIFIFASSCENLPNTLLEAMAAGVPIACSNRGPMPEILKDGGIYFDPENENSIANAVEELIFDKKKCDFVASRAKEIASNYSWKQCADDTFSFVVQTFIDWKLRSAG